MPNFIVSIYQFFNHPVFVIFGGITAIVVLVGVVINFIFWILGIAPLLWRLGFGRWARKIAVVAKADVFSQLRQDLVDSGIFREGNISHIPPMFLSEVKDRDLLLIHYQSFNEQEIKTILANKKAKAGMVFYFPEFSNRRGKRVPDKMLKQISNKENTTLVNFRGRLLNDIITTLITTSYEKK